MTRPLRVLTIGTFYPPHALGGYERIWRDAVVRLRGAGHEVKVLCSNWTANNNGEPEDPDVRRELELYTDELLDLRSDDRAAVVERERHNRAVIDDALDHYRPDVALIGPVFGLPLGIITRVHESGVPQVAFVGDEWPKDAPKADPGQQLLGWTARLLGRPSREGIDGRRFHYGDVDEWICASDRCAAVVRRAGADPATVSVQRPGPDRRTFTRRDPSPWRGQLLYAGPLFPNKGCEHAIRAVAEIPDVRLKIAGAGDARYAEKLRAIATELGVEGRVAMLGEQHDRMADVYAEADAVVFPSVWREGWGLVPLEAMAVGRPVVATAVGGSGEYLRDGENALVVRPADPRGITAAVERLAGDEELRARLVEGGFATADEYVYDRFLDGLAGAVVALGQTRAEKEEDTGVSEAHEHEPAAHSDEEARKDEREIEASRPEPEPAAVATVGAGDASASSAPRFAGVQGQDPRVSEAPARPEVPKPAPESSAEPVTEQAPAATEPTVTPQPAEDAGPAEEPATTTAAAPDEADRADDEPPLPEADEWLPEGTPPPQPEEPATPAETAEWAAIASSAEAESAPADAAPAPEAAPAAEAARPASREPVAVDAGVATRLAAVESRVAELSNSAVAGIERNASQLATLEGRVSELATSAVAGVERNAAELSALEKRVTEMATSAVAGVERTTSELASLEQRVTEMAKSAVTGVERNAAQLAKIETRLGELAAFAELRGEAIGQRVDELESALRNTQGTLEQIASRLGQIEGIATELWERDQIAAQARQRAASEEVEQLDGLAKINEGTFEQLRALGLSGTQAARLLAAREARGGFDSVDEPANIPGFPPKLIEDLKQSVES